MCQANVLMMMFVEVEQEEVRGVRGVRGERYSVMREIHLYMRSLEWQELPKSIILTALLFGFLNKMSLGIKERTERGERGEGGEGRGGRGERGEGGEGGILSGLRSQ